MKSLILFCLVALVACTQARQKIDPLKLLVGCILHPELADIICSPKKTHHRGRHARDTTWERNAGGGKIFGTLGSTDDDSLFGRGGYRGDIFNDHRGRLQGQAYGERVLGAGGDSSVLGGKLNWNNANDNVRAGVDVSKQIGGGSGMRVTGDGVWKLDHNTRFVAGGNLQKQFGHHRPEFGVQGAIEHDF